jgi:integrase
MRGCLRKVKTKPRLGMPKGFCTWDIILSLGRVNGRWKQKWVRYHGTRQQAEQKVRELVGEVEHGDFIDPTKLTVAQYLDEWLATAVKPRRTANTYDVYAAAIKNHLVPALGAFPLQKLNPLHVERYYADLKLAAATRSLHHALLSTALKAAVLKGLIRSNPASRVANKPSVPLRGDTLENVWSAAEASQFLASVKSNGTEQDAALFALALDAGARRGELLGLQWKDLQGSTVRIERQLEKKRKGVDIAGCIQPKCGGVRTVELSDETVALLQAHKRTQAEVKMANRTVYRDQGLIFAHAWEEKRSSSASLGDPLRPQAMNERLTSLCEAAGVRRIRSHGLRHTSATLLLAAGVPAHVVQRRLGHKKVEITLNLYAHVLPSMQTDAASKLAALLHR